MDTGDTFAGTYCCGNKIFIRNRLRIYYLSCIGFGIFHWTICRCKAAIVVEEELADSDFIMLAMRFNKNIQLQISSWQSAESIAQRVSMHFALC